MFTSFCKMSQADLKEHVSTLLEKTYSKVEVGDGFVYAQGSFPVLLVAHLDTVHKELPQQIVYSEDGDIVSSPQGIGGDDRCGVYMVFEIIKKFNCSVLFCEDEELGNVGARKFVNCEVAKNKEFNYIIELDRKGKNDAVFYACANAEFEKFVTKEYFQTAKGTASDISLLAPYYGCAAVNFSCGYYNMHTKQEYVVLSEMKEVICQVKKILERTTINDKFEYIEA